jgi:hypothetical protein
MLPDAVNVFADITLALVMLPPVPLPAIKLLAVIFPLAINVFPDITLALLMLPPEPDVTKLPKLALPVAFNVPAILTPVPVTINMFAFPALLIVTLLFAETRTLLLPFTIELPALTVIPVNRLPLPLKKFAVTRLPKLALPEVMLPVTAKLVNVPTEVIFGCAAVVTVLAVVALDTAPVTFAP